jgi:hypothetical protein
MPLPRRSAVPTLVLHRSNFALVPIQHGRYLADHIPNARFVEVAGGDAWLFTKDADVVLDEVAEFLTGVRPPGAPDRMLATVLSGARLLRRVGPARPGGRISPAVPGRPVPALEGLEGRAAGLRLVASRSG